MTEEEIRREERQKTVDEIARYMAGAPTTAVRRETAKAALVWAIKQMNKELA
jgi:hypothetical protein